jgi:hypothetical protein
VHASFAEFVGTIGDVLGTPIKARAIPGGVLRVLGAVQGFFGNVRNVEPDMTPETAAIVCQTIRVVSTKATDQLDFKAMPLRDLVAECVEWMRSEGMLKA